MELENTKTLRDLLRNAVGEFPDNPFLRFEYDDNIYEVNYRDFAAEAEAVAAWAESEAKKAGRPLHIALFGSSSQPYITAMMGIMISGNVAVPLDVQADVDSLEDYFKRADIDTYFYDLQYRERTLEAAQKAGLGTGWLLQKDQGHLAALGQILVDFAGQKAQSPLTEDQMAMILFTSGTTGKGKGVMLSQRNMVDNTFASDEYTQLHAANEEIFLSVLPIHHVFCLNCDVLMTIRYGAVVCLNMDMKKLIYHLNLFGPTVMRGVPMIAKTLINRVQVMEKREPDRDSKEIEQEIFGKNFVRFISGGGYLSPELAREYQKRGYQISQGYGMSECSPKISVPDWDRPDKAGTLGKPVRGCQVQISPEGEILVKSPSVMLGYYKDPEETAKAIDDQGWLHTGDAGFVDEDGFINLTGRIKNLIILANGENVAPEQIENLFENEQLVRDVIVYGAGDAIAAEVYPNFAWAEAAGIEDIEGQMNAVIGRVNKNLPSYKRIMQLRVRKEPFDKTSSGKIIRSKYFAGREKEKETVEKMHMPETDLQQKIYDLAASAMGHRKFGIYMNFYEVGLDSMGSVMLLQDLYEQLNFSITLEELMEKPTVADLEKIYWEKKENDESHYEKKEVYPLTSIQMYFCYIMKGNTTGNLPFFFKLDPETDLRRLKKACEDVFEVHPELKCRIQPAEKGLAAFRNDDRHVEVPIIILSDEGFEEERQKLIQPFSYETDSNMYHVQIYSTDSAKYLFFDVSHAMGDGMSMNIIFEDLNALYQGKKVPPTEFTYYEFAQDELAMASTGQKDHDTKYYVDLTKGFRMDRSILTRADAYDLDKGVNKRIFGTFEAFNRRDLLAYCKKFGVSENVIFLTAFNYAIRIFMDQTDTVSTSIHSGRTNSKWSRITGPLFKTYFYRYTAKDHEKVPDLLKRQSKQILQTMGIHTNTLHLGEMFFQYQGDILDIGTIGDRPAVRQHVSLDSLPFHMMVYAEKKYYTYEVRYWENRFDLNLIELFVMVMEQIMLAVANYSEDSVRRLQYHLPQDYYPKHFKISAQVLNQKAGYDLVPKDAGEVKVYVLDDRYEKKPLGAWGSLYVMDQEIPDPVDRVTYPYGNGGTLYGTGRTARILPTGEMNFIEECGRSVLQETVMARCFPDLGIAERALVEVDGITEAHAYLRYNSEGAIEVTADIKADAQLDTEAVIVALKEKIGEVHTPTTLLKI